MFERARRATGLIGLVAFAAIPAPAGSQAPDTVPTDTEYVIYSVVVDHIFARVADDTFYVHETTVPFASVRLDDSVPRRLLEIPTVSPELIDAYIAANADTIQLESARFETRSPVVLTRSSPGDIKIYLSRIGLSAGGSEAVIHYILRCGSHCGWGHVMRLENIDGNWIVREGLRTMMF